MAERTPDFWKAVQADYFDKRVSIVALCEKHGLTQGEFNHHREQANWQRRYATKVSRAQLIVRLFALLEQHIVQLENEMKTGGDKEISVLNRLVGTLGKLMEIEDAAPTTRKPRQRKDIDDIRGKLIRRIEDLKRA